MICSRRAGVMVGLFIDFAVAVTGLSAVKVSVAQTSSTNTTPSWVSLSSDSKRLIRLDSLRANQPLVTYKFRYADPRNPYAPLVTELDVEVNCELRVRRISSNAGATYGDFDSVDRLGGGVLEDFNAVCRWGREQWRTVPSTRRPPIGRRDGSSGSGLVVGTSRIVTNYHVIEDCSAIAVRFGDLILPAKVSAVATRNDLALLESSQDFGSPVAVRASAALGEDVTVAGFPLAGLLSNDLIVTSGHVNSLAGITNDPTVLQISAPVQPGNSGGPLLDRSGAVVGVVVSKLNVEKLAKLTGDIAQNVNFAIKPEVLRLFLDTNRVQYRTASLGQRLDGIDLAERARQFTVQVLCER